MKIVYAAIAEVKFTEERKGRSILEFCEGVYDSVEDAVTHIKEEYWEARNVELTEPLKLKLEFQLKAPLIVEETGEKVAEAGDNITIWLCRTNYFQKDS